MRSGSLSRRAVLLAVPALVLSVAGTAPLHSCRTTATADGAPGLHADYTETIRGTDVQFGMVWIEKGGFWIGRTEVTWDEYLLYCDFDDEGRAPPGKNGVDGVSKPSKPLDDVSPYDRDWGIGKRPAVGMSLNAAKKYCVWLSRNTSHEYRLPTEAEWELACGKRPEPLAEHAWFAANSDDETKEVGLKKPNERGLYDILGNLWEYCATPFAKDQPERAVLRGGSWEDDSAKLTPKSRLGFDDDWVLADPNVPPGVWWVPDGDHLGFRILRVVPNPTSDPTSDGPTSEQERNMTTPKRPTCKTRREFLEDSLKATAIAAAVPLAPGIASAANLHLTRPTDTLRVAVIGVHGRGRAHVGGFKKSKDSDVVAICDPDRGVIGRAMKAAPKANYYKDIRKLLEDHSIDAVSIATPNHWHSLAAIWALEAGKHVYVEKPLSHNVREGRMLVEAARKADKIVQHGTQARSMQATMQAMQFLREGGLGKVKIAHALCYKGRDSIGKVKGPQEPPSTLDYDLWTGPAEFGPLMRENLHYDWHWVFNTGNGDIGNQGVHQMDIARWGLGRDDLPKRVVSCGGRLGYDDDANTPNTLVSLLDYGDQQLIFEVRGLKTKGYRNANIGVVFDCEEGYLVSASYGKVLAFDHAGEIVKTFRGGGDHFQNFLDAIKSGKREDLNAECLEGHLSSALCHLGNISHQLGKPRKLAKTDTPFRGHYAADETFRRFRSHLVQNGIDAKKTDYTMGADLTFDPKTEQFVDRQDADALTTRQYRKDFAVT